MIGDQRWLSDYGQGLRWLEVKRGDELVALVQVDADSHAQHAEAYRISELVDSWLPEESEPLGVMQERDEEVGEIRPPEWKLGPPDPAPMCRECGRQFYHRDRCSLTGSVELAKVLR